MYIDWFSYFFGAIPVFVIPVMSVLVWVDANKDATRYQRLDAWQRVTIIGSIMLAAYTYLFVRTDEVFFIDESVLWGFCSAGIALSIALHVAKRHVSNKKHKLEQRLARAIFHS